jgi:hypothetical protein
LGLRRFTINANGQTVFVADAHWDDGNRFIVHAGDKFTVFVELERAIHEFAVGLMKNSAPLK